MKVLIEPKGSSSPEKERIIQQTAFRLEPQHWFSLSLPLGIGMDVDVGVDISMDTYRYRESV